YRRLRALEELGVVLEAGVGHPQRAAEDVLRGGLQRLHRDEVDREHAVQRDQRQQEPVPPAPAVAHAGCSRGGSNHRNRTTRASAAYPTRSLGIALRPARRKTAVNEPPRQTLNRATLPNAQAPLPNAPSTACLRWPAARL